jgi:hypothetical protein
MREEEGFTPEDTEDTERRGFRESANSYELIAISYEPTPLSLPASLGVLCVLWGDPLFLPQATPQGT